MKGGFNNPPNLHRKQVYVDELPPSMKGGFNNPPNAPATAYDVQVRALQ